MEFVVKNFHVPDITLFHHALELCELAVDTMIECHFLTVPSVSISEVPDAEL